MAKHKKKDGQDQNHTDPVGDTNGNPTEQAGFPNENPTDQVGDAANGDDIDQMLADALKNAEAAEGVDGDPSSNTSDNNADGIDTLKREIEELKDSRLRLMAEYDNYRRRSAKEYERLIESANEKLILEMVDVRENFERALKAGEQGGEFPAFYDGMKLIFAKFDETLSKNGLSPFANIGEEFDPMIHDALMNSPNPDIPADHIAEVFERGYRLKDKVIKHARVIVSSGGGL